MDITILRSFHLGLRVNLSFTVESHVYTVLFSIGELEIHSQARVPCNLTGFGSV